MLYPLLITFSILTSSAIAGQTTACDSFGKENLVPLRIDPLTGNAVSAQTCLDVHNGNAPYYTYRDGDRASILAATTRVPAASTCEHIVEVQLLKQVLESPGGACSTLAAEKDVNKRKLIRLKFRAITNILNGRGNLVFADNVLEKQKGDVVNRAATGKVYVNKPSDPRLYNRLVAVDTLLNNQVRATSQQLAALLDIQVKNYFPGTTQTVVARWKVIQAFAHSCYAGMTPTALVEATHQGDACFDNVLVEQT